MNPGLVRRLLVLLLTSAVAVAAGAGTREDILKLSQDLQALEGRVGHLEQGLADVQKTVALLAERVDALSRSAQTADLRADLDQVRRQLEVLSTQVAALKAKADEQAPALVPPLVIQPPAGTALPAAGSPPAPGVAAGPELYDQAYGDCLQGRYDLARTEFEQFLAANPGDPRAANARYWIGECHYAQKQYAEALAAFRRVVEEYPLSAKADAARLKAGLTHLALGETAQGVVALKELIRRSPDSEEAQIATERLKKLSAP